MKLGWKILIVVVLLSSFGSLYLIGDGSTGNVIWEPSIPFNNCSDAQMIALWEEVFVRPVDNAILLDREGYGMGMTCIRAIYEINGSELWELRVVEDLSIYSGRVFGEKTYKRMNRSEIEFNYINASYNISEFHTTPSTENDLYDIIWNISEGGALAGWDVSNITDVQTKFTEIFNIPFGSYGWSYNTQHYSSYENNYTELITYEQVERIYVHDSRAKFEIELDNYVEHPIPLAIQYLPDFTMEQGSGWSNETNLSNYFFNATEYSVVSWGDYFNGTMGIINYNEDGKFVNISLEGGVMKFNPFSNFTGQLAMRIIAANSAGPLVSTYFTVNVTENTTVINATENLAPVFDVAIENIVLNKSTNVTIDLSIRFSDPENETLTYTSLTKDFVEVIFVGETAYVSVGENFTGPETMRIVASDGVSQTGSNTFSIELDPAGLGGGDDPIDDPGQIDNSSSGGDAGNASGAAGTGDDDEDGEGSNVGLWIMIIAGILMVLLIIGAIVYFMIFAKGPTKPPAPNLAVKDYLKKIKDEKDGNSVKPDSKKSEVAGVPVDRTAVDNYLKKINAG